MATHDYYQLLQVHQHANADIIKASYRALLQKLKLKPELADNEGYMALIDDAYKVLSNPKTRAKYDLTYNPSTTINSFKSTIYAHLESDKDTASENIQQCPFCHYSQVPTLKQGHSSYIYCDQCGSPISLHPPAQNTQIERSAIRTTFHDKIALTPKLQPDHQYSVQMEDVSAAGIAILSPQPLTPGDRVELSNRILLGVAEVVHCNNDALPHRCGLKFITLQHHKSHGHLFSAES